MGFEDSILVFKNKKKFTPVFLYTGDSIQIETASALISGITRPLSTIFVVPAFAWKTISIKKTKTLTNTKFLPLFSCRNKNNQKGKKLKKKMKMKN